MGGVGPAACEGFLVGATCVCVLVDGAGSSLEGTAVSQGEFWVSMGFPGDTRGEEPTCQGRRHRDAGAVPGLRGSPGEGTGSSLQYSCLENPMDRGACWAMVHRIAQSRT